MRDGRVLLKLLLQTTRSKLAPISLPCEDLRGGVLHTHRAALPQVQGTVSVGAPALVHTPWCAHVLCLERLHTRHAWESAVRTGRCRLRRMGMELCLCPGQGSRHRPWVCPAGQGRAGTSSSAPGV